MTHHALPAIPPPVCQRDMGTAIVSFVYRFVLASLNTETDLCRRKLLSTFILWKIVSLPHGAPFGAYFGRLRDNG
jgi:hypothetical protein